MADPTQVGETGADHWWHDPAVFGACATGTCGEGHVPMSRRLTTREWLALILGGVGTTLIGPWVMMLSILALVSRVVRDRGAGAATRKGAAEDGRTTERVDLPASEVGRDSASTPAPHHLRTALAALLEIPSEHRTQDEHEAIEAFIEASPVDNTEVES